MIPVTLATALRDTRLSPLQKTAYGLLHLQLTVATPSDPLGGFRPVKRYQLAMALRAEKGRHRKRSKTAVTRALRHLVDLGYLEQGPDLGTPGRMQHSYRLAMPVDGYGPVPLPAA